MSEQQHEHDDTGIVFHEQDGGLPCFGCFFGTVFDALSEERINEISRVPEEFADEDPEALAYMCRVGASFATVADDIVSLMIQIAGEAAPDLMEAFQERLENMFILSQAPTSTLAN